jgi:hypothetical protein
MRKIGTLSASIGLIFLGIWMLIYRENAGLGDMVIKFWPILIILLGVEVLLFSKKREDGSRPSFNFLIIPIIIIFLCINVFQGIGSAISRGFHFDNVFNFSNIFDDTKYKSIESKKTLESYGSLLTFQADNEDIVINKSSDKNIIIDASVYTDKQSNVDSYNINETKEENGYNVKINEDYVRKVKVNLTIPDGLTLNIKGDNINIKSSDNMVETKVTVTGNNGNCDFNNLASVSANFDNVDFNLKEVPNVEVKSNNGKADITGNAENVNLDFNNGKIYINNKICKEVSVKVGNGVVDLNTEDKDINVDAQVNSGACSVNKVKKVNSGINATYGNGQNNVKIKVDSGVINVKSQE